MINNAKPTGHASVSTRLNNVARTRTAFQPVWPRRRNISGCWRQTSHMDAGQQGVTPTAGTAKATTIVAIGMLGMNALAYAFTLAAAHRLGPEEFSGVSALLGVLIVANVGALALQATAARRLATTQSHDWHKVAADIVRSALRVALVLATLLLLATPLMNSLLHLDDWVAAAMVGVACFPLTLMGAYSGIVQGERRWATLAMIYLSMGLGRIVCGGIALVIDPTMRAAMIGIAVGSYVPALLGAWFNRIRHRVTDRPPAGDRQSSGTTATPCWPSSPSPTSTSCSARHLFSSSDAGVYAAGAILSKTCLFLPTFVLVVAFPTMASNREAGHG